MKRFLFLVLPLFLFNNLALAAYPGYCEHLLIRDAIAFVENNPQEKPLIYRIEKLQKIEINADKMQIVFIGAKINKQPQKTVLYYKAISPPSTGCQKVTFTTQN